MSNFKVYACWHNYKNQKAEERIRDLQDKLIMNILQFPPLKFSYSYLTFPADINFDPKKPQINYDAAASTTPHLIFPHKHCILF